MVSLAINAGLSYFSFVALEPVTGNLVISDSGNNRIRKLVPPPTTSLTPTLSFLNPARAPGQRRSLYAGGLWRRLRARRAGAVERRKLGAHHHVCQRQRVVGVCSQLVGLVGTPTITVLNPGSGGVSGGLTFTVYTAPSAPTALISTFAGSGYQGYSGDNGPALFASFDAPQGLVRDSSLNFYVADTTNNRVRKITPGGVISTIAGNGTSGYSGDGGPATQAQLNGPAGLALDTFGNLYITDYDNSVVRKVTSGGTITTVAGTGSAGYNGDNISAITAKLNNPFGIVVDSTGNLYIADRYNNRIRKVDTSGNISTYAGTGVAGYFGDGGPATTTPINQPLGLALDLTGNLFIAEYGGNRVRRIGTDGTVYTVAGNGSCCFSGDGGPATSAEVYNPVGIVYRLQQ